MKFSIRTIATSVALYGLLVMTAAAAPEISGIETPKGIVDCLLPGQLRRIGGNIYQTPQRPARITATACTVRGGDFLLYDRANYETTLKHWIAQAESGKGDPEAMYYVGEIYEQGIGRNPDFAAAAAWYQRAADAGNTTAMISLAHLYKTGQGVVLDLETAQALYSQAFGSDVPVALDPTAVKGADQRIETLLAEVEEVRRQKDAVSLQLASANEQLKNAKRALDDALAGDASNAGAIRNLQDSLARKEDEIEQHRRHLASMQAQNSELEALRQALSDQTVEMERLQSLLADASTDVEQYRVELDSQQSVLQDRQSDFNVLIADASVDRTAIQTMSQELDVQRATIKALEETLREAEDEKNLYKALANESATHEERIATLTARISLLTQQSTSKNSEFDAQKLELSATRRELDVQISASAAAAELTEAELSARDAELARLRAAVARAEQETLRHDGDMSRLMQQSAELDQLRANLEREQAQSDRLQQLLADSQKRYQESNARIAELDSTRGELLAEIDTLRAATAEGDQASDVLLQQRESALDAARAELETLHAEIAKTETEFDTYRQQMVETASHQKEAIENLRAALSAGRAERAQLEEQLAASNQQLVAAQSDLQVERERYTAMQDQLREARTERSQDASILDEKQHQLDAQNAQLAALQQEIERLDDQSGRYLQEINDLKSIAQAKKIEFAGPRIVMLDPDENVLTAGQLPTRGTTSTRGISVVAASHISETKIIRGHVEAPAGLAQLTINDLDVAFDGRNSFSQTLKLASASKQIRIVAVDHNGNMDTKEFTFQLDGIVGQAAKTVNTDDSLKQSRDDALDHLRYYALIIANQEYESEFVRDLETPLADAVAIGNVLKKRYGFEVDILENAKKADLERELERIFYVEENDDDEENDKDAILIYYAGHGFPSDSRTQQAYFWAPVDAQENSPRTWFKTKALEDYLQVSTTAQIMVVADSCFSGKVLSRDGISSQFVSTKSKAWRKYLNEYTQQKKSRYVFTSGAFAPVLDGGGGGHSVFARAFLGMLEHNEEILSAPKMHEQVAPVVMDLAEQVSFDQTPLFGYLASAGHEFGNFYFPAPLFNGEIVISPQVDEAAGMLPTFSELEPPSRGP